MGMEERKRRKIQKIYGNLAKVPRNWYTRSNRAVVETGQRRSGDSTYLWTTEEKGDGGGGGVEGERGRRESFQVHQFRPMNVSDDARGWDGPPRRSCAAGELEQAKMDGPESSLPPRSKLERESRSGLSETSAPKP
jgi:hypothetical protein